MAKVVDQALEVAVGVVDLEVMYQNLQDLMGVGVEVALPEVAVATINNPARLVLDPQGAIMVGVVVGVVRSDSPSPLPHLIKVDLPMRVNANILYNPPKFLVLS